MLRSTVRFESILDRLGANAVAMQIPIGLEEQFKGVVDLITMKAFVWNDEAKGANYDIADIPADLVDAAKEAREKLVEAVSAIDDDLMMKYLEGEEISEDEIRDALRKGNARDEDRSGIYRFGIQEQRRSDAA